MLITKTIEIDMGHRVPNHASKCYNIHGHRYKFEIGVDDKIIDIKGASDEGMVIDFTDLKNIALQEIDERLDHAYMIYKDDITIEYFEEMIKKFGFKIVIVDFIPTAENISKYVFNLMKSKLQEKGIKLKFIKVWETPTSTATYYD